MAFIVAALLLLPRFRDVRLTAHAILVRVGMPVLNSEDAQFQSESATLSGTLVLPGQDPPAAAIVLIHGSGPATRMLWLADLFASQGLAVLTYDKRGVGKSGGVYEGTSPGHFSASAVNLDLLARDAAAAAAVLVKHPRLRGVPVGYVGLSQGGWIGPIAATKSPAVSFLIFFSGPVVTVSEQGHFENLAESDGHFWKSHTQEQVATYMQSVSYRADDVDPLTSLSRLRLPGFWVFGGEDNLVPVDQSVNRLEQLIAEGHSSFHYKVYPEDGHELVVFDFSRFTLSRAFQDAVSWIKDIASQVRAHGG